MLGNKNIATPVTVSDHAGQCILVEPMGFESASCMEIKEFCRAIWPSKELKGKERNS